MSEPPTPPAARLAATAQIELPGRLTAFALASAAGAVAAGDVRGEGGIWQANGARRAAFRLQSGVAWVDLDADGVRAAFVGTDGETLVSTPDGPIVRLRLGPGSFVLFDRAGPGFHLVDPESGRVQTHDAAGRALRRFDVPAPVASAVSVPRTGGLVVLTGDGRVVRVTPSGAPAWIVDLSTPAAGLAVDPQGDVLLVCRLGEGAEVLQASSGARLTTIRVGHRVSSAAVSATAAVLGCTDRMIVLLDRRGATRARGRAPAKVEAVGVSNAGAVFARLADGTVRAFTVAPVADRSGGARTPSRLRVLRGDAG